jgi:hypothetical protein
MRATQSNSGLPVSSYILIAANLVPLLGVIFYQWDSQTILALYWIENLIIGGFNIVRMAIASAYHRKIDGVFLILFFCFHYGLFCAAHGTLLVDLIGFSDQLNATASPNFQLVGPFVLFNDAIHIVTAFIEHLSPAIVLGVFVILLSRGVSFIEHFILRGELFNATPNKLMMAPYSQILVMHVGLIVGAMVLKNLNDPIWLLAVIVILKIVVDYSQHVRRHKKQSSDTSEEQIKDL